MQTIPSEFIFRMLSRMSLRFLLVPSSKADLTCNAVSRSSAQLTEKLPNQPTSTLLIQFDHGCRDNLRALVAFAGFEGRRDQLIVHLPNLVSEAQSLEAQRHNSQQPAPKSRSFRRGLTSACAAPSWTWVAPRE